MPLRDRPWLELAHSTHIIMSLLSTLPPCAAFTQGTGSLALLNCSRERKLKYQLRFFLLLFFAS